MENGFLHSHPLLKAINDDAMAQLFSASDIFRRSYAKNHTLHAAAETCVALDIVVYGKLFAYALSENGNATTMFEFSSGAVIGANLLFSAQNKYPLTICCQTDCSMIHLTSECVKELLHNYQFALAYIQALSKNSDGLNQKVSFLSQNTLRENLSAYLKKLMIQQNSDTVLLPMSKKQLADYMGVQRPSLFRELKKMQDEHLLRYKNRTITLYV